LNGKRVTSIVAGETPEVLAKECGGDVGSEDGVVG